MPWIESNDLLVPFDHACCMRRLNELTVAYPFVKLSYLGNSILNRNIPLLTLGHGKREILYVGAHHGMEWITAALLTTWTKDLCETISSDRRIGSCIPSTMLELCTLYILPMLNPDGVEYQIHGLQPDNPLYERVLAMNGGNTNFSHWQANARGVDLNHNYDAGFAEYKQLERSAGILEGAPTRYSGEEAESEPEVRLLCNFIRFHIRLCGVMTLHTQGEEIFYRSGGASARHSEQTACCLSRLCGYRMSDAEGLASYGGLTDWCIQKLGLPAFTLECGKGVNPLPLSSLSSIYCDLREALFTFPYIL